MTDLREGERVQPRPKGSSWPPAVPNRNGEMALASRQPSLEATLTMIAAQLDCPYTGRPGARDHVLHCAGLREWADLRAGERVQPRPNGGDA